MLLQNNVLDDLCLRGLLQQQTGEEGELFRHLEQFRTVYCGFDPTADSLHIGSLVPLLALRRFQLAGHKPIALVGGATGLIGDPSFKSQERKLNANEVVAVWVDRLQRQVGQFIDFDCGAHSAEIVNNLDWIGSVDVLGFLRDVGKHFSVNSMIQKESVKQRLQRDGEGISFTEFTYMLLQSFDYAELYKRHGCSVQIGGSDQWGNITGGIDLTRRMHRGHVFGLTLPLVTKADGTKFGKTESGTIWLDAKKTSPYAFYQFWLNTADEDVYKFLKYFTFLAVDEIDRLYAADVKKVGKLEAQGVLADEVTKLVHGDFALRAAKRISTALFCGDHRLLSVEDYAQLQMDGLPSSILPAFRGTGLSLVQLLTDVGMATTGKQVKDALMRGVVEVNGRVYNMDDNMHLDNIFSAENAMFANYYLIKLGKKKYHLFHK